jgi:hypothetical protein
MRIGGIGARPTPSADVATALLTAASSLGQRPAVTSVGPHGRDEQGFVSLAGWAAKGANLLRDEFDVGPGDRLGVASPAGWPLAAVTLAAWWLGVTVVHASEPGLTLRVVHVALDRTLSAADGVTTLWLGDAVDGSGVPEGRDAESWTDAVIPYPDRAPEPARDGGLTAIGLGAHPTGPSQQELIVSFADDPGGALGITRDGDADLLALPDAGRRLAALVLRPLVTGAASVVVMERDAPDRHPEAHAQARDRIGSEERIVRWLE